MRRPRQLLLHVVILVAAVAIFVFARKAVLPLLATLGALVFAPWLIVVGARALGARTGEQDPRLRESVQAILAALGVAVVLFWVVQGALTSRLQVDVFGDSYPLGSGRTLVIASIRVSNVGSNDVSVAKADLTITPRRNNGDVGAAQAASTAELQFDRDHPDAYAFFVNEDEYCFAWGTATAAQVARVLPEADYYDIRFEMQTRHKITRALATWRGSAVSPSVGTSTRSPDRAAPANKEVKASVLDAFTKALKGL